MPVIVIRSLTGNALGWCSGQCASQDRVLIGAATKVGGIIELSITKRLVDDLPPWPPRFLRIAVYGPFPAILWIVLPEELAQPQAAITEGDRHCLSGRRQ